MGVNHNLKGICLLLLPLEIADFTSYEQTVHVVEHEHELIACRRMRDSKEQR